MVEAMSNLTASNDDETALVTKVTSYVEDYMSHYDSSHDYAHIQRVLGLARHLASYPPPSNITYDPLTITLSALLHDVGDKKYLLPGQDGATLIHTLLLSLGASAAFSTKIQTIVSAVSYTSEMQDPGKVRRLIEELPELAVVQDADRLDAIGAVGVGRTFTYGGAKGKRGMEGTVAHFEEKLERLEGLMKTARGREMARERTERLKVFRDWWKEETEAAQVGLTLGEI